MRVYVTVFCVRVHVLLLFLKMTLHYCCCCKKKVVSPFFKKISHKNIKEWQSIVSKLGVILEYRNRLCALYFEFKKSLSLHQSILIHRNSGFRGVRVLFNHKLGSKNLQKKYLKLGEDVTFQAASFSWLIAVNRCQCQKHDPD